MSVSDAVTAIHSRGDTLWPAIEATVPLYWLNDPPVDRPLDTDGAPKPFIMMEIKWNGGEFRSIGAPSNNVVRRQGHIWIFALIARGTGDVRAHELAGKAASMFEGEDFSGVMCEAAAFGGEADVEDGSYFGQSVAIPFDYEETA